MQVCGQAVIKLKEIYEEAVLPDNNWLSLADSAIQGVENLDSTETSTLRFYYLNNRKNGAGLLGDLSYSYHYFTKVGPNKEVMKLLKAYSVQLL